MLRYFLLIFLLGVTLVGYTQQLITQRTFDVGGTQETNEFQAAMLTPNYVFANVSTFSKKEVYPQYINPPILVTKINNRTLDTIRTEWSGLWGFGYGLAINKLGVGWMGITSAEFNVSRVNIRHPQAVMFDTGTLAILQTVDLQSDTNLQRGISLGLATLDSGVAFAGYTNRYVNGRFDQMAMFIQKLDKYGVAKWDTIIRFSIPGFGQLASYPYSLQNMANGNIMISGRCGNSVVAAEVDITTGAIMQQHIVYTTFGGRVVKDGIALQGPNNSWYVYANLNFPRNTTKGILTRVRNPNYTRVWHDTVGRQVTYFEVLQNGDFRAAIEDFSANPVLEDGRTVRFDSNKVQLSQLYWYRFTGYNRGGKQYYDNQGNAYVVGLKVDSITDDQNCWLAKVSGFGIPYDPVTGIVTTTKTELQATSLNIFPNPASNGERVQLQGLKPGQQSVRVVNMLGQTQTLLLTDNSFEVKNMAAGVYLVEGRRLVVK